MSQRGSPKTEPKSPRGRPTGHPLEEKRNRGTAKEFEQEEMGVAPKE